MNIFARSALLGIFVLLAGVPTGHSAEYFIYQDAKGVLVHLQPKFQLLFADHKADTRH